eukprot:8153691-Alexandrium_andersonii.AAC.1
MRTSPCPRTIWWTCFLQSMPIWSGRAPTCSRRGAPWRTMRAPRLTGGTAGGEKPQGSRSLTRRRCCLARGP